MTVAKYKSALAYSADIGLLDVSAQPAAITDVAAATAVATAAATASTAPAGGTGATAGAYDSAANRDLMIASLTATQVDVAAIAVIVDALVVDLALARTATNAIIAALEAHGIVAG